MKTATPFWGGVLTVHVVIGVLLAGCFPPSIEARPPTAQPNSPVSQPNESTSMAGLTIYISDMYAEVTFAELSDTASAIFLGRVTDISAVQWNQDSGKYWDSLTEEIKMSNIPLHYLAVDVVEAIVNTPDLPSPLQITVLNDHVSFDAEGNMINNGERPHDLKVGDQAVFFVRQTDIAWRGGMRPAVMLLGVPSDNFFRLEEDGLYHGNLLDQPLPLDELIALIRAERETLPEATATPAQP